MKTKTLLVSKYFAMERLACDEDQTFCGVAGAGSKIRKLLANHPVSQIIRPLDVRSAGKISSCGVTLPPAVGSSLGMRSLRKSEGAGPGVRSTAIAYWARYPSRVRAL